MTLKNRGWSKKTEGQKTRAVVWQWIPTFKKAVTPTPPGLGVQHTEDGHVVPRDHLEEGWHPEEFIYTGGP